MILLKYLARLIKILRSAATPGQIAGGFVLGMILGLTPLWSLHNLLVIILLIILNVNMAVAIFSFGIFSGFAYLLDPLFHNLGYYLLVDVSSLHGLWTTLYNMPIIALSRFNNTVVMGSLVVSILLILPVFLLTKKGVILYREKLESKFQKFKIVQLVKGSKIYSIYEKIKNLGE